MRGGRGLAEEIAQVNEMFLAGRPLRKFDALPFLDKFGRREYTWHGLDWTARLHHGNDAHGVSLHRPRRGTTGGDCPTDANGNGQTEAFDLAFLPGNWVPYAQRLDPALRSAIITRTLRAVIPT